MAEAKWTTRLSKWAFRLGWFSIATVLGAALLGRFDVLPKLTAFGGMMGGVLLAALGTLIALIAVFLNWRHKPGMMRSAALGLAMAGGLFGFMASRAMNAQEVPAIHDVTTDLQSPPQFVKIKLPADNLRGVETVEKWRELHASAYSSLAPAQISRTVPEVFDKALAMVKARGWKVALADKANGRIEATASVSLIGFQDDVVILISPAFEGKGATVNMRSVSQVGIGDLGVNAKRIREFLGSLTSA
jgi:uncharacterized protein (DUF1499 family)